MHTSFRHLLPLTLTALLFGATQWACGSDDTTTPGAASDAGASNDGATTGPDASAPGVDGSAISDAATSDASPDAPSGPTISEDPEAPTTLVVGKSVSASLASEKEHFFAFTAGTAGDYTLNFTSADGKFYASYAAVKGAHGCGLPSCVQGSGTAPLKGLTVSTTYYLNLYNGSVGTQAYTLSVTTQ